jgi:hypothetical protein
MKYFISFLIVFIFIGMIINSFNLNAPKIDIQALWNDFSRPYQQFDYLEYNNNNYGIFNIFRDIYNGLIAFFNSIITVINAIWIAFQILFRLIFFVSEMIFFIFAFISFLFTIPFLNILIMIILIIIIWDFIKFIKNATSR